jgi:hypothetical protein
MDREGERRDIWEPLKALCAALHEAGYVYHDPDLCLLFVWNRSLTVNIWVIGERAIYPSDVIMFPEKPRRREVRASIRRRIKAYRAELEP